MRIRKSVADLTDDEAREFIRALLLIKVEIANPDAPADEQITIYDRFVAMHGAVMSVAAPGDDDVNMGHWYPGFLPWHREFLLRIERALNSVAPDGVEIAIPYWPWSDADATRDVMLQDAQFGLTAPGSVIGPVQSGFFAQAAPAGDQRPDWWPDNVPGWFVRSELQTEGADAGFENSIYRQVRPVAELPTPANIESGLGLGNYHWFWRWLEGGISGNTRTHNSMHGWIGGTLSDPTFSPMDPVFVLNHVNVDRLWAAWQDFGHSGSDHYPSQSDWTDQPAPEPEEPGRNPIPIGHKLNDAMWPWVGTALGYSTNMGGVEVLNLPHLPTWVGDYSNESARHPVDVLDTTNTGDASEAYVYQDPVVRFSAVRKVLDQVIGEWTDANGGPPNFGGHGADFGWETADQLRNSEPKGQPLIKDEFVGSDQAGETNLIKVLTTGLLGFGPRMPRGGPFLSDPEIGLIAKWIDDGCVE